MFQMIYIKRHDFKIYQGLVNNDFLDYSEKQYLVFLSFILAL